MAEPTIQLGGGNWAGKTDNLLGYYKEGERFYKQDFTFSRSTTGTYTDSDGYIQEMPYNFLQQSNQFDTTWNNNNTTETYDSNLNAWLIEKNGIYGFIRQFISLSGEQTLSVFAKASTLNWLHIKGSNNSAYFNLENGVLGSYNTTSASIESVGNGFYRCSITYSGAITDVRIYPADGNNDVSGTSGSIYIQNAQLVKGTSAKTYFPTTTRLNMPRVDYLNNSNGSLILEPQRTNVLVQSTNFSGGWSLDDATKVSNSTASPDGTVNAITLIGNTNASRHHITQGAAGSVTASLSVFAKAKELRYLQIASANSPSQYVNFDVSDGTIGTVGSGFTNAKIEDYGNGWYRCSVTSTNQYFAMYISLVSSLTSSWLESWTMSNNTDGLYLYGAQLEQGNYTTSYIPTNGTSVTRVADVSETSGLSDYIGQSEGSFIIDFKCPTGGGGQIYIWNGTIQERLVINIIESNTRIDALAVVGNSLVANENLFDQDTTQRTIYGIRYRENDFEIWVNGVLKATETGTFSFWSAGTLDQFDFNDYNNNAKFVGNVNKVIFTTTYPTDEEMQQLTTI
jgi:hypothetical protein